MWPNFKKWGLNLFLKIGKWNVEFFFLGTFCLLGRFVPWDVLSLGTFCLGTFCLCTIFALGRFWRIGWIHHFLQIILVQCAIKLGAAGNWINFVPCSSSSDNSCLLLCNVSLFYGCAGMTGAESHSIAQILPMYLILHSTSASYVMNRPNIRD